MNVQESLLRWAGRTSHLIGSVFDECSKRFEPARFQSDRECMVLWQLIGSCHTTGESALILIGNVRLWDADVLMRSVVEGTVKFIFLTLGTPAERNAKLDEFVDVLGAAGRIKRHQRLEQFLAVIDNPQADEWRPFRDLLLSNQEVEALSKKYPRATRKQLNQKWSFAEISAALHHSGAPE